MTTIVVGAIVRETLADIAPRVSVGSIIRETLAATVAAPAGPGGNLLQLKRNRKSRMSVKRATTSLIYRFKVYDSTQVNGAGLTGLTSSTAGLLASYSADGAAATGVTLSAGTVGTWASGSWVEIDSTHLPGWYEFGVPNAAVALAGRTLQLAFFGATNMFAVDQMIDLTAVDAQDATAYGLSRLDAAVSTRAQPSDIDTQLTAQGYTTARAAKLDNLDVANSTLLTSTAFTAAFPANFSTMAIDGSGLVTINNISAIVDGVWDENGALHVGAGTTGLELQQASQSAGTPWTRIY